MDSRINSILIFVLFSSLYVLSMFQRMCSAVIAPDLVRDLGLSFEALGMLGGAYFYSFALLQLPLGLLLDLRNPRTIITLFSLVAAAGSLLLAVSNTFVTAFIGRILIGAGTASILLSALKIFSVRFPPARFTTLTGSIISAGTIGSILAAAPLAYLVQFVGWRPIFIVAGLVTLLFSLAAFWFLGGENSRVGTEVKGYGSRRLALEKVLLFVQIVKSLTFWQIGTLAFFRYGTMVSLQGLWLGPYLMNIENYSVVQTGNMLTMIAIGTMVGGPISGSLADRFLWSRKRFGLCTAGLYTMSLLLMAIVPLNGPMWYGSVFFLMGFFCVSSMVIYTHAKEAFPESITGTVIAGVNLFTMAGGAVFMPLLGEIIKMFVNRGGFTLSQGYHFAFLFCSMGMAGSLIFYAFSHEDARVKRIDCKG